MPFPRRITRLNRAVINPVVRHLAGRVSPLDLVRHRGLHSGRQYDTPILAFPSGESVTIALTYGPDVQWLANIRAAGGCELLHRGVWLVLGAPTTLDPGAGLARMPVAIRTVLRAANVTDFVELPVLSRRA